MNAKQADILGDQIVERITAGQTKRAFALLAPILSTRTPFRMLDRIGARIGAASFRATDPLLAEIARHRTLGGWPLLGAILAGYMESDPRGALRRCRAFIIDADVWHATDSLGERVLGPAYLGDAATAMQLLSAWRTDQNRWVRRSLGVGIHFWAKRAHGDPRRCTEARRLLTFLRPLFPESDLDAAKGIGWALKTMGRYYPEILADWMVHTLARSGKVRALMIRKATKFLPAEDRNAIYLACFR
jgi:3-methyladenine DNA glycosylase AlkD